MRDNLILFIRYFRSTLPARCMNHVHVPCTTPEMDVYNTVSSLLTVSTAKRLLPSVVLVVEINYFRVCARQ